VIYGYKGSKSNPNCPFFTALIYTYLFLLRPEYQEYFRIENVKKFIEAVSTYKRNPKMQISTKI
jgi:hypothetical protein